MGTEASEGAAGRQIRGSGGTGSWLGMESRGMSLQYLALHRSKVKQAPCAHPVPEIMPHGCFFHLAFSKTKARR